jgi:hypothetical protein
MNKERTIEKKEEKLIEQKEEQKPLTPPRKLSYVNSQKIFPCISDV